MTDEAADGGDRRPADPRPADVPAARADEDFARLRALITGPEQREIRALEQQIASPARWAEQVTQVLPDAVVARADDPRLARALSPLVEDAITTSVRRDPQPLADALYPAIGPAIRKAITHTLAGMMESLNRTIEHSVSWRAVQWRLTAIRTGKPFAEIVLLNTLQYRVEQVFLIHGHTGLLLQQAALDADRIQDADQVSAMLTAIGDFVRDSFKVSSGDRLDALRVGPLTVVVEQGPHATLAGVVRGTVPSEVRAALQDALESIHQRYADELAAFSGDTAPFERVRPTLESCLVSQYRQTERSSTPRRWLVATGVLVLALGVWGALVVRDRLRWNDYLDRLRAEPGIVVLAGGRRGGKFVVSGLRDPLAVDPSTVVASSGLALADVEGHWEPYQALHPQFVTERARNLLRAPAGVRFTFEDGVLTASGDVPDRWIAESGRLALALPGVRRFAFDGPPAGVRLEQRLEERSILFPKGSSRLAAGQEVSIRETLDLLRELNEVMRLAGTRARVDVVGHTDTDGSDLANAPLSAARAASVLALIQPLRLDAVDVASRGVGSTMPLAPSVDEPAKQRNRRVGFQVDLGPAATAEAGRP